MRNVPAPRTGLALTALVLGSVTAMLVACGGDGQECRLGADCESGQCTAEGLCVAPGGGSSGSGQGTSSSSGVPGTSSGGSSGTSGSSGVTSSSSSSSGSSGTSGVGCVANMDGTITKDEVPQQAGLVANFRFASNATVNLTGVIESGTTKWDLTGPFTGDYDVEVPTKAAAGSWYASSFPTASYSVLLGKKPAEARGVLRVDQSALSLLGLVSNSDTQPTSGETNMVYDVAVPTLTFPLTVGSRWETVGARGTGKLAGYAVPLYGSVNDTYRSVVDASGALVTPYGIFPVLRVVTAFERVSTSLPMNTDSTTIAFVTECAGTVAKLTVDEAVDVEGKTTAEIKAAVDALTTAVEVQRLAAPL